MEASRLRLHFSEERISSTRPRKIRKLSIGFLSLILALRSIGSWLQFLFPATLAMLCGCKQSAETPVSQAPPIRVAALYWPGDFWIGIAAAKGWFREAGLNVQLVSAEVGYIDSEKDLVEGQVDASTFVLFDLLDYTAHGASLVGIVNADYSAGTEKLVARPGIEQVADLKGKKVALPRNSYLRYVLEVAIGRVGLKPQDVEIVDIPPEKASEALIKGDVDAMLTFEPYATEGLEAVKGNNIFDTSEVPGLSPNLIVFQRKFIEERPSEVETFVKVWHRTATFIKAHPDEAFQIIASVDRKTPEEVRHFAKIDKILDLRDNELAFSFAAGFDSLHGAVRQMNDFMIARGITDKKLDSSEFLEGSFIGTLK
jgi:NitT/TauT family transport system substrate-binding protein